MREPFFIAAIGTTGSGKTYQNIVQMRSVVMGNMQKHVAPRRVLILDSNMEFRPDNKDVQQILGPYGIGIKTIHYKDVYHFTRQRQVEICRIVPVDDNGRLLSGQKFAQQLNFVLENFVGGLLVCEDFKGLTGNSLNQELIQQLTTRRHAGCDTLISMQSLSMIQPTLLACLQWIRLHRTLDPVDRDQKFKGLQALLHIANNLIVNRYNQGDERFFVKISLLKSKLEGMYTQKEIEYSIRQYIYENYSSTVKKKMLWRDNNGKKLYTEESALKAVVQEYSNQYSQYSPRYSK